MILGFCIVCLGMILVVGVDYEIIMENEYVVFIDIEFGMGKWVYCVEVI